MSNPADFPNVILVVLDTARADAFEPYGASAGATPTFAQLASAGALHAEAISSCNWTMPSHVSMFSGLLPRTAGLSALPDGERSNCRIVMESHRERWLPDVLKRSGYATAAVSTNAWVTKQLGFATGFDEFRSNVGKRVHRMHDKGLRGRLRWYAQAFLARVDDGLTATERRMDTWIENARNPFFWFVNLIECHSPYMPPRPYNDVGPLDRLRSGHDARRYQDLTGVWKACATGVMPPEEALARMRHMYERSIRMMDDWLARLCEKLDHHGVLDDTLLIVTSDHGENFGEGNLFGHAVSLDDRLLRVPLVFAGPGAPSASDGVTSLVDLPRLVARAIGLEDHPWTDNASMDGVAVAQYDLTPSPDDPRLNLLREWGASEEGVRRFAYPCSAATDGRYKLVVLGDREQLFDLESDPLEVTPLTPDRGPPEIVERFRRSLRAASDTAWTPDVDALRAAGGPAEKPGDSEVSELEDRMRLLGYL